MICVRKYVSRVLKKKISYVLYCWGNKRKHMAKYTLRESHVENGILYYLIKIQTGTHDNKIISTVLLPPTGKAA